MDVLGAAMRGQVGNGRVRFGMSGCVDVRNGEERAERPVRSATASHAVIGMGNAWTAKDG